METPLARRTGNLIVAEGNRMKEWLKKAGSTLLLGAFSTVVTSVVTSLITGQPLKGLTKLEGLSQIFLKSTVPAWIFALTLLGTFLWLYAVVSRLRNRRGRVQFVSDAHNSGWAQAANGELEVRAGGTFTYEGTGTLPVIKAFLKGTEPTTDMMALQNYLDSSGGRVPVHQLDLDAHVAVRAFVSLRLKPVRGIVQTLMNLRLKPVSGTKGKPLKSRLVFRDKYNRDYAFRVILPYTGQR